MANRWAILIGVDGYHESLGALNFCGNDARLMKETLASDCCGFSADSMVLLAEDQPKDRQPTFGNIHGWLGNWLSRPSADDLVLVYFSGHGCEANGQALMVPLDATRDSLNVTGIPVQYARDLLDRCKARQKVLILDACHSGAGKDVVTMTTGFRQSLDAGQGLYTIASCDVDQLSHEWPEEQHGVFTHYLVEAIRHGAPVGADGRVSLDHVYEWTREKILSWTAGKRLKQEPVRICRLKGSIHIASRPLTIEQRLAAAKAEIRAQAETNTLLRQEIERLQADNSALQEKLSRSQKRKGYEPGRSFLTATIVPHDGEVEWLLDHEPLKGRPVQLPITPGQHVVQIVPSSLLWGCPQTKLSVEPEEAAKIIIRLPPVLHSRAIFSFVLTAAYGALVGGLLLLMPENPWSPPYSAGFPPFGIFAVIPSAIILALPAIAIAHKFRGLKLMVMDSSKVWQDNVRWVPVAICLGATIIASYLAFGLTFAFSPKVVCSSSLASCFALVGTILCLIPWDASDYRSRE